MLLLVGSDMSGPLLLRWMALSGAKKIRVRYADAAWFRAIAVMIAKPPGLGLISNCYRMDPATRGR